ncbi:hypothetical protein M1O24_03145 [Dehalococcoidia bacterium]|nr:hypothetical protein [Dehalococcoidia bacterium]MCL0072904.1 hypothetical protein [Dehalococcoidia bacterium]MCL0087709.1 hypothetical protein [Dehalococcoidia bacterium]MCL0090724.1 hypothetical protein [Dehalococcoidia bacterium]MCL0103749.1 hypothetical protein [Dehalococcoidia bacterium]
MVFREKRIAMDEFLQALEDNFEGHERLHQLIMNRVPKFGNDEDAADICARADKRLRLAIGRVAGV